MRAVFASDDMDDPAADEDDPAATAAVHIGATEVDREEFEAQVGAALARCTLALTPVEVEDLLWSSRLAEARGGSVVSQLADGCYAVLRDEAGAHAMLPGGYSIVYLQHDTQSRALKWSCSCPAYARCLKRFGGKSMLGGARLCPCGSLVLLAQLASRTASQVVGSGEGFAESVVGSYHEGADNDSTTDSTERASSTAEGSLFGDGVFYDSFDVDAESTGGDAADSTAGATKATRQAARALAIARAMLSGPRLPVLVPGGERARLHKGLVHSQMEHMQGDGIEWREGTSSTLFPLALQPLEVLQNPVNPGCTVCPGQVLLRRGELSGRPVWVLCGRVLAKRRFSEWQCSGGSNCTGGLMGKGRFCCMGVPWTLATGFVNVQNSFFVDRLTLDEMHSWVFAHGNPVLVAAAQVASRACAFMVDVTAREWTPPPLDWLHRMLYMAFWWVVCMTDRPWALCCPPGLPAEQLPDLAVLAEDEQRQPDLLSEEQLYALCEERLVSLAVGGAAVQQRLPVHRVPPILHPGIRGTPRNTEYLKSKSRWSDQARKDLKDLPPPTTACFGPLSRIIADGLFDGFPDSLRDPRCGLDQGDVDKILKEIGADIPSATSLAQKKAFLCCACFSLRNVGEADCHVFVQAVMGTGGLCTMSCPHGYSFGWKFLLGGHESVRDPKDMLKSSKCWPPLVLMDTPCGEVAHMEANEPANTRELWGSKRGCWREFAWERDKMDLTPIRIPEYSLEARAARLAAIADDPSTAILLASRGESLLSRHPLMPPLPGASDAGGSDAGGEDADQAAARAASVMRLMMCDCFHQGLASAAHKSISCQQHNFRMCPDLSDIPTTFMESINKVDRLHLRSICVQDPGVSHRRVP